MAITSNEAPWIELVGEYAARAKHDVKDGIAWMIVGLLESIGAAAMPPPSRRSSRPRPIFPRTPCLLLPGSIADSRRPAGDGGVGIQGTITRKPARNDLLDASRPGPGLSRSQRSGRALEIWNRLEPFSDDLRVRSIAATLVEEGQFDLALPRLTKMADQAEDKYRQTSLRLDAADLKVKLKKTGEAIADFEKLLGELNPEKLVVSRRPPAFEEVFLRSDDLAGLAKYYEKWLEKNKTDVDAIAA